MYTVFLLQWSGGVEARRRSSTACLCHLDRGTKEKAHSLDPRAPASPHNHISEMLVQDSMASKSEKLACKSKPLQTSTKSTKNLLEINQIPIHLRFNKYVLTHYRPPSDLIGCLKSLFYLHNETVNILTHGK